MDISGSSAMSGDARVFQATAVGTFEKEAREYRTRRQELWDRNAAGLDKSWGGYYRKYLRRVYATLIPKGATILELGCGRGDLLASLEPSRGIGVDFSREMLAQAKSRYPELEFKVGDVHSDLGMECQQFDYIILSDLVNDLWDVQAVLENIQPLCHPGTRIICNFHSHLWGVPLKLARKLGVATPNLVQNWLTPHDMDNLFDISGFESLRTWQEILVPFQVPGLAELCNKYLVKVTPFRFLGLANFMMARVKPRKRKSEPTVSVIVAARNEAGHIEELMERIPEMGGGTEIVFVEGNSSDDTYETIERVISEDPNRNCILLKQPGKGKGDAVRCGFAAAKGDILMILDADITVPPEDLPRFFNVIASGEGEFVNGVRLVYPMDEDAMRFANLLGNKFFSWAFSWLLGQPIRDTLCGTKVLWADDYKRIVGNRSYFGDFDPFGDFDLLFGAAKLNLKIKEVPIRYRARRYGDTNIDRWRHGALLLRMVAFAAHRLKFV